MLSIQRLNCDSSWLISTPEAHLVIDPWFEGVQKNGPGWFNTQWLPDYSPGYKALPNSFSVFVAFPFTDHFHAETVQQLNAKGAEVVLGFKGPKAYSNTIHKQGTIGPVYMEKIGGHFLHSGWIIQVGGKRIFYTPHGFSSGNNRMPEGVDMWIGAVGGYVLPFWLGGEIALGFKVHQKTLQAMNPKYFTRTHDLQKPGKGLVAKFGKSQQLTDEQDSILSKDSRFIPLLAGQTFIIP